MNLVMIATLSGLALLLVVILAMGIYWFLQRRSDSEATTEGAANKTQKAAKKKQPAEPPTAQTQSAGTNSNVVPDPPTQPAPATPVKQAAPPALSPSEETGEKIRILIVDDNPGTRDNVSRLLYFEDDMEVIGQAINGRQGIEMTAELRPHIVLMDINMPDMDGITATKEMAVQVPFAQVVIMSVQSDQHYMKQAMAAGARDFQPKPFTSDELVSCLRRVYKIGLPAFQQYEMMQQAQTQKQSAQAGQTSQREDTGAPVIAVYSPKGGVGVSAIAANLAVALHRELGDVALMDAKFQFGDILVHLNTRPTRTVSDMVHEGNLELDLLPDVLLPHDSGIKLLLAPPQPQLADFITDTMIADVITELKKQFRAVVVDTGSQLTDRTLAVLEQADFILMVTVPELPAIKSTKLFLEIAEQLDFNPNQLKVVVNRANAPGGVRPEQIEAVLKLQGTYRVPHDPKMHIALNRGASICQQEPGAPSARAIVGLAQQVWREISEGEPAALEVA